MTTKKYAIRFKDIDPDCGGYITRFADSSL